MTGSTNSAVLVVDSHFSPLLFFLNCKQNTRFYYLQFFFYTYNRAAASADDLHDELKICCGQLISREASWEHKMCDGNEEDYHVGGLVIELERCPHIGCGSCFNMNPLKNIAHQDIVHRSIILYSCGVCRGCYVSEGL